MPTAQQCEVPGCTAEAHTHTVTGQQMCEHCHDNRVADEAACTAINGAPAPLAFVSWWRRLFARHR